MPFHEAHAKAHAKGTLWRYHSREAIVRIYITGNKGQLGSALRRHLPSEDCSGGARPDFDITDLERTRQAIVAANPDVVIHCAAMTDVDGCARNPALAQRVNGDGTRHVALSCADADAALVLLSSNEVFSGEKDQPYVESDQTDPISPYGHSKLAAEQHCRTIMRRYYIVRTSWLYAPNGSNFVHRIQELAKQGHPLSVVSDELGAPTSVDDLAESISQLIKTERYGIYHLVNAGHTSRHGFARAVLDHTGFANTPIRAIAQADFQRASTPPRNGSLANRRAAELGITLRPWQIALDEFLGKA